MQASITPMTPYKLAFGAHGNGLLQLSFDSEAIFSLHDSFYSQNPGLPSGQYAQGKKLPNGWHLQGNDAHKALATFMLVSTVQYLSWK